MSCSNITGSTADRASPRCISIRGRRGLRSMRRPIISNWRRGRSQPLFVAVSCNRPITQKPVPFFRGLLAHRREMRRVTAGAASIETSNNIFNEVLCQVDGRPQHADDGNAAGPLSLCGHSLVLDDVRPRRTDHRAADAVDRSAHRARRAAAARFLSGQSGRSARRRRARQDPARDARRRDGGAARGAVRAILRQRRFDAAVRAAGRPLCRAHRRRGDAAPSCGRRSRRRCAGSTAPAIPTGRLRRIPARDRAGACQSGLEGFVRRDLPCRWAARRRLHRAGRGPGLRVRRQAAGGALRPRAWDCTSRRAKLEAEAQRSGRAIRGGVLVRGNRHLRAGARRRQAAVPGAHLQCRAAAVHRHCAHRTAPRWSPPG